MQSSDTLGSLTKALLAAQKKFPSIPKSKTGTIPTKNGGSYSYNYADLPDIKAAIDPILSDHDLTVSQFPDGNGLCTILLHNSGEFISATADLYLAQQTAQGQGSAITYMRRYAYCAATGVVAEDDDDGAAATHTAQPRQQPTAAQRVQESFPGATQESAPPSGDAPSEKQWGYLAKLTKQTVDACKSQYGALTKKEMSKTIDGLKPSQTPQYEPNHEPF